MKECPFCSKPTNNKPDNFYKCYIALGGGAYFCHRCGAKGSWYDLKSELGGFTVGDYSSSAAGDDNISQTHHRSNNNNNNNKNYQQQYLQQPPPPPQQRTPQPLPMPHLKLNSIHSSRLFDPQNSPTHNTDEYNVMQYLQRTRGLNRSVLQKYGVGCAMYTFPSKKKLEKGDPGVGNTTLEYVRSMCVTFPWLMRQSEVQEQEELRGAEYVWRRKDDDDDNDEDNGAGDSNDEREKNESKRRMEAAAAVAAADKMRKKNSKPRSEMTALERYYAKKERAVRKKMAKKDKKDKSSAYGDDDDENDDIMDQFQFTPQVQQQEQVPGPPLTSEEVESLHGPYITRRIKVRSIEQKSWQRLDPAGGGFGLFGWHTIPHDSNEIIITEGEFDAMAVYQATGRHAVSLPNGCRSLPMEVLVLLERFDTIYLWMDNDGPGREGAEMFARKLGVERCLLVQPSGKRGWKGCSSNKTMDGGENANEESDDEAILSYDANESRPPPPKDANEALLQGWDINELLSEATELPHERILKFSDLREQVGATMLLASLCCRNMSRCTHEYSRLLYSCSTLLLFHRSSMK